METVILVVHVVLCLGLVGLVLLQQGKGADAGASFGGGASQTVFGGQGGGGFLTRSTGILAAVFFLTSFALAVIAKQKADGLSGAGVPAVQEQEIPTAIQIDDGELPGDEPAFSSSDTPDEGELPGADQPIIEAKNEASETDLPEEKSEDNSVILDGDGVESPAAEVDAPSDEGENPVVQ